MNCTNIWMCFLRENAINLKAFKRHSNDVWKPFYIVCVRYFFHISFYTLIIAFRFLYRSHFVLPIIFVSLCLSWGTQAFSQVTFRFDEKSQTEEMILKFAGESYRTRLDASGRGIITVPNNLDVGYVTVYGPRSIHMFYLVPRKRQGVTKMLGQNISFAGEAEESNGYLIVLFYPVRI